LLLQEGLQASQPFHQGLLQARPGRHTLARPLHGHEAGAFP
jgi:hypothetical protein